MLTIYYAAKQTKPFLPMATVRGCSEITQKLQLYVASLSGIWNTVKNYTFLIGHLRYYDHFITYRLSVGIITSVTVIFAIMK